MLRLQRIRIFLVKRRLCRPFTEGGSIADVVGFPGQKRWCAKALRWLDAYTKKTVFAVLKTTMGFDHHAMGERASCRVRALAQSTMASATPCTNIDAGSPEGGRPAGRDSEPAELRTDP